MLASGALHADLNLLIINFDVGLVVVLATIVVLLPMAARQSLRVADATIGVTPARNSVDEGRLAARAGTARKLRASRRLQPVKLRAFRGRAVRAYAGEVRIASARSLRDNVEVFIEAHLMLLQLLLAAGRGGRIDGCS